MSSHSKISNHKIYRKLRELSKKTDDASRERMEFLRIRFVKCKDHGYMCEEEMFKAGCLICGDGGSVLDDIFQGNPIQPMQSPVNLAYAIRNYGR